ncbi:uncharacterized protein LOC8083228 [Sorghum bicolor]|uniref:Uncharacterized protein n=1 Tax=Sorghum bicolor TaxID=4558 RepID=C5X2D0_SORBI|nr:uncharacterized protein LOC8083228 [Sorghum bicolor]EER96866.1 hypothetical protein SORBI_3002G227300 [Sorghum bicolor]|eukprot:XP_002460345.1 uncharacterized protein LOC8083228 [Sorghum bicolor]
MPCLAQEFHPKLPAANHYCKSLSSLIRETYAHCHVPCVRIPAGAGWSSGEDTDDDSVLDEAQDTKQVILNEMRNRQMKKRSRCSVDSPSPTLPLSSSSAFAWSYTPLDPRTVLDKVSSPKTCVVVEGAAADEEKEEEEEEEEDDGDYGDADDESEAFFSVKSFFTRSTSRAATVASSACMMMIDPPPPTLMRSPEALERFRDCEGWPFGLCRRPAVLPLPPLPSTPADSWKWRKSVSSLAASPTPAYRHKIAAASSK